MIDKISIIVNVDKSSDNREKLEDEIFNEIE